MSTKLVLDLLDRRAFVNLLLGLVWMPKMVGWEDRISSNPISEMRKQRPRGRTKPLLQPSASHSQNVRFFTVPLGFKRLQIMTTSSPSLTHLQGLSFPVISSRRFLPPPGWLSCCLYSNQLITAYPKSPAVYHLSQETDRTCLLSIWVSSTSPSKQAWGSIPDSKQHGSQVPPSPT